MNYNKTINKFIKEKFIDVNSIINNKDALIYTKKDINLAVSICGMYKNEVTDNISISNVIGKSRGITQNILLELNDLFDENGSSYKKRSNNGNLVYILPLK